MRFLPLLVKAELVALGWLAACAVAFSLWVAASFLTPSTLSLSDRTNQAVFLAIAFFAIGFLPVLLYGAPAYAYLLQSGHAKWWSVLLLGLLPGLVALPMELSLGAYALSAGGVVSLLTHLVMRRGANNSFKPNPLRGSA